MDKNINQTKYPGRGRFAEFLSLSPLALFLCLYLSASLMAGDFYKIPVSVVFMLSAIYAIAIFGGSSLRERLEVFSSGATDTNILLMIWIFILAGGFAQCAKDAGCIDATVGLVLNSISGDFVPAGLFIGACFISLSIGTSVGTVMSLVPVAAGIADVVGVDKAMMVAIVVGGAFFGDNLSFVSDTTIAATRTQGCRMQDKFLANLKIVLPAACIVLGIYFIIGMRGDFGDIMHTDVSVIRVVPYLVVLVGALVGINVAVVLVMGIFSVLAAGILSHSIYVTEWLGSIGKGISGMGELIIVTLLAAGMLELMRRGGGISLILRGLTRRVNGPKKAALSIAALVSVANICTANNTIAIITVGQVASDISRRFGLDSKRVASILDTFSCVVQGLLPYGAQVLMAAGLSQLSPLSIIRHLYYPAILAGCALIAIAIMPCKHGKGRILAERSKI